MEALLVWDLAEILTDTLWTSDHRLQEQVQHTASLERALEARASVAVRICTVPQTPANQKHSKDHQGGT